MKGIKIVYMASITRIISFVFCIVISFCFLMGLSYRSYAQNPIIPLAPSTANLAQSVETPVGLYTGTPIINIPIYTIETGSYKLPISLSYTSGGVKVADVASWCGLGWNLNAGGFVGRGVVGLPDEDIYNGYNAIDMPRSIPNSADTMESSGNSNFPLISGIVNGNKEGKPDNFFFAILGAQGRLINTNGFHTRFHPLPMQKILFRPEVAGLGFSELTGVSNDESSCIEEWEATDGMGNKYKFSDYEKSATIVSTRTTDFLNPWGGSAVRNDTTYKSVGSWYLTYIATPDGDTIKFDYETVILIYDIPYQLSLTRKVSGSGNQYLATNSETINRQVISSKRLSAITFANGKVRFIPTTKGRADLIGDKALDRIVVENIKGDIVKQFALLYDYMISDYNTTLPQNTIKAYDSVTVGTLENNMYANFDLSSTPLPFYRRLFLRKVIEQDKNGNVLNNGTQFEYHRELGLKVRDNQAVDHWGYANGYTGTNPTTLSNGTFDYIPEAKAPNLTHTKQGSLYKIIYPTGGYVEYKYEENYGQLPKIFLDTTGYSVIVGGTRLEAVKTVDPVSENNITKRYLYFDGATSAVPYYKTNFEAHIYEPAVSGWHSQYYTTLSQNSVYPMTATQGSLVGYGRVEEYLVGNEYLGQVERGKTVYYFSNPLSHPDSIFTITHRLSKNPPIVPNPPVDNRDWQRGLLLKKEVYAFNPATYSQDILKQKIKISTQLLWTLQFHTVYNQTSILSIYLQVLLAELIVFFHAFNQLDVLNLIKLKSIIMMIRGILLCA